MKRLGQFRWFRFPRVYTWEDVKKQILEDMEREGLYIEGMSVGSTIDAGSIMVNPPAAISGIAGTSNAAIPTFAPDIIVRAGDTAFVFEIKQGEPLGKGAEQEAIHADF
ncbi:hypothetical protein ES703_110204 [subsurface metagenome]